MIDHYPYLPTLSFEDYVVALVMWRSAAIILEFRLRTIGGTPHKLRSGPTDRSEALGRFHIRRWYLGDATNRKER
jgi:hypothetical protein